MYKKLLTTFGVLLISSTVFADANKNTQAEAVEIKTTKPETTTSETAESESTTPESTMAESDQPKTVEAETVKVETTNAADDEATDKAIEDPVKTLTEVLVKRFKAAPNSIKPSVLEGVYEVMYGTEVVYFSKDGKYFLAGDMIELESGENISELAKKSVRKSLMASQDFKPVVFKADDEKHKLTVFTDIDCGYCAKLHREMPELNAQGITVEYLMFPRAGIGSNSFDKAVSMWCADDQQKSMTDAKARLPIETKQCDNPIEMQYNLGRQLGVSGTPALVTASGRLIPGYMPADKLAAALDKDAAETN